MQNWLIDYEKINKKIEKERKKDLVVKNKKIIEKILTEAKNKHIQDIKEKISDYEKNLAELKKTLQGILGN